MTTAELRTMAREAEAKLDWATAADLYSEAIKVYPGKITSGTLAALDVANLQRKADGCAEFAMQEAGIPAVRVALYECPACEGTRA